MLFVSAIHTLGEGRTYLLIIKLKNKTKIHHCCSNSIFKKYAKQIYLHANDIKESSYRKDNKNIRNNKYIFLFSMRLSQNHLFFFWKFRYFFFLINVFHFYSMDTQFKMELLWNLWTPNPFPPASLAPSPPTKQFYFSFSR